MESKIGSVASSEDIWGIVANQIDIDEEYGVTEITVHLEMGMKKSYVKIKYFDLSKPERDNDFHIKRYELTPDDADKMYRKIYRKVHLPEMIDSLETKLTQGDIPLFDIKLVPMLK